MPYVEAYVTDLDAVEPPVATVQPLVDGTIAPLFAFTVTVEDIAVHFAYNVRFSVVQYKLLTHAPLSFT